MTKDQRDEIIRLVDELTATAMGDRGIPSGATQHYVDTYRALLDYLTALTRNDAD